ncbi:M28 family peptidase [Flavobacterium sp. MAH-1]|uniref:M28 family peptidase n=1 Tax=Flavobacterium agri TaxID=2743471 RepID=A0A7Y8XYR4_9FLAO|nr:M28 family peptidase [Flavobacterium agri]NUY79314.1 M28 family peptidase [Flavobacterium agri]NYA69338.1 M28 family peptidase [Flavobacterium agri]
MPRILRPLLGFALLSFSTVCNAQSFISFYNQVAGQVSQTNITQTLTEFENFGIKYRGTSAQANALNWLKAKYQSFGYSASQIVEDPFSYSGSTCKNLVVTKIGTTYPNTFVIIDGHYDTVGGPGTNDNGSGTAILLEIARLLKDIPTEYSIKFIHFAGEEDGLVGSQHYVDAVVNGTTPKMDIRVLVNIDEVGGVSGETNNTITCEKDQSNSPSSNNAASATKTTELANCMELYSVLETTISNAYASDYMPFEDNGEIITGLYETNESPYPHGPNDTFVNMDPVYVFNVCQGMTGAALHFAVACTSCSLGVQQQSVDAGVSVFPNPANDVLYVNKGDLGNYSYELVNVLGQTVRNGKFSNPNETESIATDRLQSGLYVLKLHSGATEITKKVVIK